MPRVVLNRVRSSRGPVLPSISEEELSTLLSAILPSNGTPMMTPGTLQVRCFTGWVWSGDLTSVSRISVTLNCQVTPVTPERAQVLKRANGRLAAERR